MKNGDTQSRQRQPPGSLASETIRNKRPPGADISFSISRAPIDDSLPLRTYPRPRYPGGPFGNPLLRPSEPSALFFSVIFPAAHLSLLNETGEADGAGALLFFFGRSSPLSLSSPFSFHLSPSLSLPSSVSSSLFCHRAPDAKKRGLFESQPGDRLSSGTSKGHNSATWNFPLREVVAMVVGASVSYGCLGVRAPPTPSPPLVERRIYGPVCFALVIHRVFCFKSLFGFQSRRIDKFARELPMRCL